MSTEGKSTLDVMSGLMSGSISVDNALGSDTSHATTEPSYVSRDDSTDPDSNQEVGGDNPEASSNPGSGEPASSSKATESKTPNKEVITITDDKGRRKVEVDFNNREEVKKYVQMAYGARKWQAERDHAIKSSEKVTQELTDLKTTWNTLENTFKEGGVEGLIDLLEGKRGAYQSHIQKQLERAKFLENASPDELKMFNAQEQADRQARELDRIRKENETFRKEMTEKEERADLASMEARVHPVFDKYRFADKLGSPDDEAMFDEMLWNSALRRLQPYEEQGLAITQELVDREFRSVATALRKRIGQQAEKKASKVVEQRKQEATENVQSRVMSGYKQQGGAAKEAQDFLDQGNVSGLLKNWGRLGSVFNKK